MKKEIKRYRGQKFKILQTGNFYFPYIDRKMKFIVEDTLELEIDRKEFALIELLEKMKKTKEFKRNKQIYFDGYAKPIWKALEKRIRSLKEYNNCWFVPIRFADYGEKTISVSVDVLRKAN